MNPTPYPIPGRNFTRRLRGFGGALIVLGAAQIGSAATVFTDNFSDGSASDWRKPSGQSVSLAVAADDPTGEPTAASEWAYANASNSSFNFFQSPSTGFSGTVGVTAGQSVQLTVGIEYVASIIAGSRIELHLDTTNSLWASTSATDTTYGMWLEDDGSGSAFNIRFSKRNGTSGTDNFGAVTSSSFSLTAGTYYQARLTVADGGVLTAAIYDASGGQVTGSLFSVTDTSNQYTSFASALTLFRDASTTKGFRMSDISVQTISTIPEPATYALLLGGSFLTVCLLRRRSAV